ncbi:MAG: hypothetical protein Ct9H90mP22_5780 [Gammaproteobacteria bacterium]|nr:MAG: hypothetical protein Ct9H90mP22_5780 [Gammaproteobacteria bacterium]
MDYDPINIAPEGVEQGIYFSTEPGVYDKWAVKFGYTPNLTEKRELHCFKVCKKRINIWHR